MAQVTWSSSAENDMKAIYDYISADSEHYAERVIDKIYKRVSVLESNTNIGKVVPEFNDTSIREIIEAPYRIIYKVESVHNISIARVYHGARLLKQL